MKEHKVDELRFLNDLLTKLGIPEAEDVESEEFKLRRALLGYYEDNDDGQQFGHHFGQHFGQHFGHFLAIQNCAAYGQNSGNFKIDLYSRSPENSENINYVLSSPLKGEMRRSSMY